MNVFYSCFPPPPQLYRLLSLFWNNWQIEEIMKILFFFRNKSDHSWKLWGKHTIIFDSWLHKCYRRNWYKPKPKGIQQLYWNCISHAALQFFFLFLDHSIMDGIIHSDSIPVRTVTSLQMLIVTLGSFWWNVEQISTIVLTLGKCFSLKHLGKYSFSLSWFSIA